MTVKQLAYLIAGFVLAYLCYTLPILFLIKIPLAVGFAALGAALAFVPIEKRPMDVMIANFFADVFATNQYIYNKTGKTLVISMAQPKKDDKKANQVVPPSGSQKLQAYLKTTGKHPQTQLDDKETAFFTMLTKYNAPNPTLPVTNAAMLAPQPQLQPISLPPVSPAEVTITPTPPSPSGGPQTPQQPADIQKPTFVDTRSVAERQQEALEAKKAELTPEQKAHALSEAASVVEQTLGTKLQQPTTITPSTNDGPHLLQAPSGHIMQENTQKEDVLAPAPITPPTVTPSIFTVANLLSGTVKDPRGNVLQNILVEVKDASENPVRAFKTNKVGQFASATPLQNGTYTVTFEDPGEKNQFEPVTVEATGIPIIPLTIGSVDDREKLRRSLFN